MWTPNDAWERGTWAVSAAPDWLVSFAPVGFNELRAFVPDVGSPAALAAEQTLDLAEGISRVLNLYADLGFQSFNMALVGAHPESEDGCLFLQLVCRSNPQPHYRSDVTYWERLHRQAMVDYRPERLAELARPRFEA
jgi:UDPglucose--hexose-1-phosphate uridylyltransferase